ncbi:MAG: hypothetical protein D6692_10440 [Planctomycetota bacterium]|nr:MAG: hypothetical protein D6692_10440 [Planctomycetota bacterium]
MDRAAACIVVAWGGSCFAQPVASMAQWSTLGGGAARSGGLATTTDGWWPARWVCSGTAQGTPIEWVGQAGVAATAIGPGRVFAVGLVNFETFAFGVDAETGEIVWQTALPDLIFDSWSSPTLDPTTGTVLFAAGEEFIALREVDGSVAWATELDGPAVNVTPVVTDDLGLRNRAFVTDYGGFGGPSRLYCVNVSPFHPRANPHQPGDIVWSVPIGSSMGGTPAYMDGVVYVCGTGLDTDGRGEIYAFDATVDAAPAPTWIFDNPITEGFFGGLTVREMNQRTFVYAASYSFYGGTDSANMVKVDASDGSLVWSIACNRTDSIPVVLDDCRIALAGGVMGFGSVPMVELFQDHGGSVTRLWDTAHGTWNDANQNSQLDLGEFLVVGGWTTQPAAIGSGGATRLLVGAIPTDDQYFGPCTALYELDLSKAPGDPGFVLRSSSIAGSTPGLLGRGVYSVGTDGLAALGAAPPRPDMDQDGDLDIDDLYRWHGSPTDVDRTGVVNAADGAFIEREIRRNERRVH